MIFTDRTITVQKGASSIDEPIILYRGDKEAEIRFALNEKVPFKFGSGTDSNMIEKTEAAYGQLIIKTPNGLPSIFSDVAPTKKGAIVFKITAEMIDEVTEVGKYTFQIRLLDEGMNARVTLPEVNDGIEIREPIALEDVSTTNEVNVATVGYALTTAGTPEDTFDSQGNYNKTTWGTGDRITAAKLNKIEAGIDGVNQKVASGGTGGQGLTTEQAQQLSAAYQHSQSTHAPSNAEANVQPDWNIADTTSDAYIKNKPTNLVTTDQLPTVPTNVSAFTNDVGYTTETFVTNKIAEAQLGGGSGSVDLSGYVTKETGNANQITFADGQTFQSKLDAGTLKGEKGDKGDQGPQGIQGPKGDSGADNINDTVPSATTTYSSNKIETIKEGLSSQITTSSNLINQNGGGILKIWAGTKVEYDALLVKDEDTVYLVEGAGGGSTTPVTTYTVTNNLSNCTNSNTNTSVDGNSSYTATITANDNYKLTTLTVTMGGNDITSTAVYDSGSIFIESVTGDIIITASSSIVGYDLTNASYSTNQYFSNSGDLTTTNTNNHLTILDYIEIPAGATITMEDSSASTANMYIATYDTNKAFISRQKSNNGASSYSYTAGPGVKYIRLALSASTEDKANTMRNNIVIKINDGLVKLPSVTIQ